MPALPRLLRRAWFPAALALLYLYNFPFFRGMSNANELPRIYLAMAIVDRGALDIETELRRHGDTPDTSTYQGKRYSNKAPGMSFLAVPTYLALKVVNGWRPPEMIQSFFWLRLLASTIPSLLFLVLLARLLRTLVPEQGMRRLVLAAYALGTMAFTYGTLLIAHQLSSLLLATAFILLFFRARGQGSRMTTLWAGLSAGAGVLVDYQVAFIGPPLFCYLLWTASRQPALAGAPAGRRGGRLRAMLRPAVLFGLGAALPLGLLLLYHWGCFGSPFRTGYHFPTNPVFRGWHSQGFLGLSGFRPAALWGRFFSADDGLFWYSPFLLLALPGLVLMIRDRALRAEGILCAAIALFFVYFSAAAVFISGWDVGPRYITCALPYLLIPAAVVVVALGRRWPGRVAACGLMVVSIVIYLMVNAVFPHYPDNFSNPWFDLTLRFARAGYVAYNGGWALGLSGAASLLPYLAVGLGTTLALLLTGEASWRRRLLVACGALTLAFSILVFYYLQLGYRSRPVPVSFLPWMERIWEPRHQGMDLARLLPAGDPLRGGLQTRKP